MKNLILTMAVIIFALPVCAYTLELNSILTEKKAINEVFKLSVMDGETLGDSLDSSRLKLIVEDNLKEQFPRGGYRCEISEFKDSRDYRIRIIGDRGSVSFMSTSLLEKKGGNL